VGRPHFREAMVGPRATWRKREAAFDLYLGKGKPAYTDRFRLSGRRTSIAVIRGAGRIAVLGLRSPGTGRGCLAALIAELKARGSRALKSIIRSIRRTCWKCIWL